MGVGRTSKKVRTFRPTSLIAQEMLPSKQQKSKRAKSGGSVMATTAGQLSTFGRDAL